MTEALGFNGNIHNHNNNPPEASNYAQQLRLLARLQQQYGEPAQLHPLLAAISGNNYAKSKKSSSLQRGSSYDPYEPNGFDIEQSDDYEYHPSPYDEHPAEHTPVGYYQSSQSSPYAAPYPAAHAKAPSSYSHPLPYPKPHPYPPPPPPEPIITISKNGKKSKKYIGSTMNALTLLAFFFFVNILQNCIKDHMNAMNPTVMVLTANRIRNRNDKLAEMNSREQTSTVSVAQPDNVKQVAAAAASTAHIVVPPTADLLPTSSSLNVDNTMANNYNNKLQQNTMLITGTVGFKPTMPTTPANVNFIQNQPAANANNLHELLQTNSQPQQQHQLLFSNNNQGKPHHLANAYSSNNNNYNNNYNEAYEHQLPHHTHVPFGDYANSTALSATTFYIRRPLTNYPVDIADADVADYNTNYAMYAQQGEYTHKRHQHNPVHAPNGNSWSSGSLSSNEQNSFAHEAPAAYQSSAYAHTTHSYAPTWSSASLTTHSGGSPFYADADHYDDSYYTRIN